MSGIIRRIRAGGTAGLAGRSQTAPVQVPLPEPDGIRHSFVELPGLRMHVAEAGSGEPVLLLHGFPQHWWQWHSVIPALAEHYRVIVPDLRGAGWTDAPSRGYTRDQLLADVVGLLDVLGLDRVRLIGHDWGALVGFQLCLRHPERVRRFLSLAIPHPYMRFNRRLVSTMPHAWYQLAIIAPVVGPRFLGKGSQRLPRYLFRRFATNQEAWAGQDLELYLAPLREPRRARAGSALYRGFITREFVRIITGAYGGSRLRTPTRILVGADDPVVRPEFLSGFEKHADELAVEVVQGCSHFLPEEQPAAVVDHALEFLARA